MKLSKKCSTYLVICLVLLACCLEQTEATRRVNRGRRTLTRRYFSGLAIPGWALIVCVAIAELIVGGALYFIMKKVILDKEPEDTGTSYTPAATTYTPAQTHEPTNATPSPPPAHATTIA